MDRRSHLTQGAAMALSTVAALSLGIAVAAGTAHAVAPASPHTGARLTASGTPSPTGTGRTFHVDSVNGDDARDGLSGTNAWRTMGRITQATFSPGDVVAFKRGQVISGAASIDESGTSGNPITLAAYGSGTPPVLKNPGGWHMLKLNGQHLRVTQLSFTDGAVFDNADGAGITGDKYRLSGAIAITANGRYAEIVDNEFTDVGIGVKTYGQNTRIQHNSFHDLRIAYRGMDAGAETSYGAVGVSANNSDIDISYNDFLNCRSTDSPYGADGGAVEIEGFDHDKNNIDIHHNYARGNQGFLEVTETHSANVRLYYNMTDDYQQFIAWDTTTTPSGYQAWNNTVIRTRDNSRAIDIYYYRQPGPAPQDSWLTLRNNIFYMTRSTVFSGHNYPHSNNLFAGSSDPIGYGFPPGDGDIVADPRFVNPGNADYHLTAGSPAWDSGVAHTLSGTDLDGTTAPVGAARDIGAYERAAGTVGGNLVADGGFESQTTLNASSSPWNTEGALAYGVDINAGKSYDGADNGWIWSGSTTNWGAIRQTVAVTQNTNYRMTVHLRDSGTISHGYAGAKTTGGTLLGEVRYGRATAYTRYVINFNSGANTTIRLHIGYWAPGSDAWVQADAVTLTTI
ncbi:choice-of-anchor Q domain-containing protein [Micromonospora sp. BQ11]|uniref:choice-of-anchor Q domain-containing protein n=1 Tax=Micromonospora sp. BQ11 TaxID=3452212 RepID=UPI003F8AE25F